MVADAKHTPEPWVVGRYSGGIYGPDDVIVASMTTPSGYISNYDANARRIVACVNACEGIPDSMLRPNLVREMTETMDILLHVIYQLDSDHVFLRMFASALDGAMEYVAKVRGEA